MKEIFRLMEAAAQKAVDINRLEEGWFIRGIIDGMSNKKRNYVLQEPLYGKEYECGYEAATKWDRM